MRPGLRTTRFLICINDFSFYMDDMFIKNILFADDTTRHSHDSNLESLISRFVNNFADVSDWIDHNQLILNYDKTKFMFIANKHVMTPHFILANKHEIKVVESHTITNVNCTQLYSIGSKAFSILSSFNFSEFTYSRWQLISNTVFCQA
jgi:hypothetical protein